MLLGVSSGDDHHPAPWIIRPRKYPGRLVVCSHELQTAIGEGVSHALRRQELNAVEALVPKAPLNCQQNATEQPHTHSQAG